MPTSRSIKKANVPACPNPSTTSTTPSMNSMRSFKSTQVRPSSSRLTPLKRVTAANQLKSTANHPRVPTTMLHMRLNVRNSLTSTWEPNSTTRAKIISSTLMMKTNSTSNLKKLISFLLSIFPMTLALEISNNNKATTLWKDKDPILINLLATKEIIILTTIISTIFLSKITIITIITTTAMPTTITTTATIIALPKSNNNNHKASFNSATNFLTLSFNEIVGCLSDPILHKLA
mmetsp:Transcript_5786/g.4993  ORF Transcript_5786/g.4993 Transcript_5786/m.4993 type:complete len:234 (+) Transcript_5786:623-1324(+)